MPPKCQASKKSTISGAPSKKGRTSAPQRNKKRAATASAEGNPVKRRRLDLDSRSILLPEASTGRVLRNRVVKGSEMNAEETSLLAQETQGTPLIVKEEPESTASESPRSSVSVESGKVKRASPRSVKDLTVVEIPNPYDSADSPTDTESTHEDEEENRHPIFRNVCMPPLILQKEEEDAEYEEDVTTTTETETLTLAPQMEQDDTGEAGEPGEALDSLSWTMKADRAFQTSIAQQVKDSLEEYETEEEYHAFKPGERPDSPTWRAGADATIQASISQQVSESAPDDEGSSGDSTPSESETSSSQSTSEEDDSSEKEATMAARFKTARWHSLEDIKKTALAMNELHAIIDEAGATTKKALRPHCQRLLRAFDDIPHLLMAKFLEKEEKAQKERLVERVEHHMEFMGGCGKGVLGPFDLWDLLKIVLAVLESPRL